MNARGHGVYTESNIVDISFNLSTRPFWFKFAVAANVSAVGFALVAALPGFVDWAFGIPGGTEAKRIGLMHMGLNIAALALFAVNLAIHVHHWADPTPGGQTSDIVLSALGIGVTLAAGFLGWALVQDHGVGVSAQALPAAPGEPSAQERTRHDERVRIAR